MVAGVLVVASVVGFCHWHRYEVHLLSLLPHIACVDYRYEVHQRQGSQEHVDWGEEGGKGEGLGSTNSSATWRGRLGGVAEVEQRHLGT